jgi:hypothetical protein
MESLLLTILRFFGLQPISHSSVIYLSCTSDTTYRRFGDADTYYSAKVVCSRDTKPLDALFTLPQLEKAVARSQKHKSRKSSGVCISTKPQLLAMVPFVPLKDFVSGTFFCKCVLPLFFSILFL